jgi:hypothetical protein
MVEQMARRRNRFCLRIFVWKYTVKCSFDGLKKRSVDNPTGDVLYGRD